MTYEFKKLSDVNVIESINDNLNVLVEDSGEVVKISANNMIPSGVVKSVNGEVPDEAGNVNVSGLPEGVASNQWLATDGNGNVVWEDKFGSYVISWDGNTEGLECVEASPYNFYKVSNKVPALNHLRAMEMHEGTQNMTTEITLDMCEEFDNETGWAAMNVVFGLTAPTELMGYTFAPGLWFPFIEAEGTTAYVNALHYTVQIPTGSIPAAAAVADAVGETPTAAEFNALLTSLRNAGLLAVE